MVRRGETSRKPESHRKNITPKLKQMAQRKSPWITPATAAKLRGVKRQSMYNRALSGTIRSKRIDGRLFVHADDVATVKLNKKKEKEEKK